MRLNQTIDIYAGGPGSGCNPMVAKCGKPETLYHGTTWDNAKKIFKEGLKSKNTQHIQSGTEGYVYTTGDIDQAGAFSMGSDETGRYAIVHLKIPHHVWKRTEVDPNTKGDEVKTPSYRTKGDIGRKHISHIDFFDNDRTSKPSTTYIGPSYTK